jgi:hypothetical protein
MENPGDGRVIFTSVRWKSFLFCLTLYQFGHLVTCCFWCSQLLAVRIWKWNLCEHWIWSFWDVWSAQCCHIYTSASTSGASKCQTDRWRVEVKFSFLFNLLMLMFYWWSILHKLFVTSAWPYATWLLSCFMWGPFIVNVNKSNVISPRLLLL